MAKRRRRDRFEHDHEPEPDPSDLVEYGGELYFAVGETAGGAPIGLRLAEHLAYEEADCHSQPWAKAKGLLRAALATGDGRDAQVGRVTKLGDGLSRDAFVAEVTTASMSAALVVLLPRRASAELAMRTKHEARLLARLARFDLPMRIPRPIAVLPTPQGPALVREFLAGIPADLRAGRMPRLRPWALVAELAAAIHAVPVEALGDIVGHTTRRDHGVAAIASLAALEPCPDPRVAEALAWLRENLPPDEPAALLHGDLLGQNILLTVPDAPDARPALIDWEYAQRGDPAYDLAIVTRGVRQPFQLADGFDRLLGAYCKSSTRVLTSREVRFHELCLALEWYRAEPNPHARPQHLRRIEIVLELGER